MATFLFKAHNGGMDMGSEYNRARFKEFLKENDGKEFRIEKVVHPRSLNQNALYWLFLGVIERETGNDSNDLHEYFKRIFLPPKFITVLGKEVKIPASTTELNKVDFGAYLDKISSETGVSIPDTEEFKKYRDSAPMHGE